MRGQIIQQHRSTFAFCFGVVVGLLSAVPLFAQALLSWEQKDVTPMIAVRFHMDEFIPANGNALGPTWKKEQVVPMIIVKPSVDSFVPKEGAALGLSWQKPDVKPIILVKYHVGGFVPAD